jgi:hypothetical protein
MTSNQEKLREDLDQTDVEIEVLWENINHIEQLALSAQMTFNKMSSQEFYMIYDDPHIVNVIEHNLNQIEDQIQKLWNIHHMLDSII